MRELTRVELYSKIIGLLMHDNYKNPWINNIIKGSFVSDFLNLLNLNIILLDNIENKFLVNNNLYENRFRKGEFQNIYNKNIDKLDYSLLEKQNMEEIKKLDGLINKDKDEIYAFNSLINLLNRISNKTIEKNKVNLKDLYINRELAFHKTYNRVFLSHAFDDKLYTLCLFIYMLNRGIFLYVDWLFCEKFKSGEDIKQNLMKEILLSDQLLFLRTINSEFSIRGSGNIRGWCSWELGSFYSIKKNNKYSKFYIELYRRGETSSNNIQLDGMKPLKMINYSFLG